MSEEEESVDNSLQCLVAGARPKKKIRRPGMEVQSVRQSISMANIQNKLNAGVVPRALSRDDSAKTVGFCYRFGKGDHLLRNCPMPYTKQLTFAPRRDSAKSAPTLSTNLTSDEGEISETAELAQGESEITEAVEAMLQAQSALTVTEPNDVAFTEAEEAWIEQWMGERTYTFQHDTVIFGSELSQRPNRSGKIPLPDSNDDKKPPRLISDSGASPTVVGKHWIS